MKRYLSLAYIAASVLFSLPPIASRCAFAATAPVPQGGEPLLGGEFFDATKTPIAYIWTGVGSCSGLLVAPRHVLTAAHCVVGGARTSDYWVWLAGNWYQVAERWYHSGYSSSAPFSVYNNRFDMGILILPSSVTNIAPVPVLVDDRVGVGEAAVVTGFGTNEISGLIDYPMAKAGAVRIDELYDGMLHSQQSTSGAVTCAGDSGGPVFQVFGNYAAVVGLVSGGSTKVSAGFCISLGDSESLYVDLQSAYAKAFLANYPTITKLSGRLASFYYVMQTLSARTNPLARERSLSALKRKVKPLVKIAKAAKPYADGRRWSATNNAIKFLVAAANAPSLATAKSAVRKAGGFINRL